MNKYIKAIIKNIVIYVTLFFIYSYILGYDYDYELYILCYLCALTGFIDGLFTKVN